jgi:hypothetical protein
MYAWGRLSWRVPVVLAVLVIGLLAFFVLGSSDPHVAVDRRATAGARIARRVERVHLRIEAEPPGAQLLLDGVSVENPFDGTIESDDRPRVLEVRREGYRSSSRLIVPSAPQEIHLVLEPEAPAAPVVVVPLRRPPHRVTPRPVIVPLAPRTPPTVHRTIRPRMSRDEI